MVVMGPAEPADNASAQRAEADHDSVVVQARDIHGDVHLVSGSGPRRLGWLSPHAEADALARMPLAEAAQLLAQERTATAARVTAALLRSHDELAVSLLGSIERARAEELLVAVGSAGAGLERLPEAAEAIAECAAGQRAELGIPSGRLERAGASEQGMGEYRQRFARGVIHWSAEAGAQAVTDPVLPVSASPSASRRRRRLPVIIGIAVLLAGGGVGAAISLDNGQQAALIRPVNTCAHLSTRASIPTRISSVPVGRPGKESDYISATAAPGCQVFALAGSGTVRIVNMMSGRQVSSLAVDPGGWAFAAAFTPDGTKIEVPSLNGYTTLWRVDSGQQLGILDSDPATASTSAGTWVTAMGPDGAVLYTGGGRKLARAWNLVTLKPIRAIPVADGIGSLALSPDGKTLAVGGMKGTEYLFDTSTGRLIASLTASPDPGYAFKVAFSPDGKLLAVATYSGLQLWDIGTRRVIIREQNSGTATDAAFSPDGAILAVGYSNTVKLWNVKTGQVISTLDAGSGDDLVTGMAFSRYDAVLAIGFNGAVQFWDISGVTRISQ